MKIQQVLLDLYNVRLEFEKMQQAKEKNVEIAEETSRQLTISEQEKNAISDEVIKIKDEKIKLEKQIRENEFGVFFQVKCEYKKVTEECAHIETLIKNANVNKNKLLLERKMKEDLIHAYAKEIDKLENVIREYRILIENQKIDPEIIAEYKRYFVHSIYVTII